jgi:hypothetical protein
VASGREDGTHGSHVRTSSSASASQKARNVCWVIVDALDSHVGGSQHDFKCCDERWTDDAADVARFQGLRVHC